jgi:hypothetical protein
MGWQRKLLLCALAYGLVLAVAAVAGAMQSARFMASLTTPYPEPPEPVVGSYVVPTPSSPNGYTIVMGGYSGNGQSDFTPVPKPPPYPSANYPGYSSAVRASATPSNGPAVAPAGRAQR